MRWIQIIIGDVISGRQNIGIPPSAGCRVAQQGGQVLDAEIQQWNVQEGFCEAQDEGIRYNPRKPFMYRIISRAAAALLTVGIGAAAARAGDAETCRMSTGADAVAACSRVIARHPKSAAAWYNRALAHGRKGDYDRAIADLDKAIRRNSKNANFYTERCWAYDSQRNYDRAIADCEQAVRLDPTKVIIHGHRADAGAGNGEYNRAIAGEAAGGCRPVFT